MGSLPLRVNNWPFSYFDDAVARRKAHLTRSIYELDVCPLIPMMMYVVGQFTEQDALRLQDPMGLFRKRRERVRKGVMVFL